VAAIIVPHDVQLEPAVTEPPKKRGRQDSVPGFVPSAVVPPDELLRHAADVINAGRKVAMLVGAGALHAGSEVERVAERVGAGVAKSLLGKAVVPDDLSYVTGSVGWLGTPASNRMMRECDTLLMVGTNFRTPSTCPNRERVRGVQIDFEPRNLALRHPIEAPIMG
jgi:pyruvate dehydrogenase (quinone)